MALLEVPLAELLPDPEARGSMFQSDGRNVAQFDLFRSFATLSWPVKGPPHRTLTLLLNLVEDIPKLYPAIDSLQCRLRVRSRSGLTRRGLRRGRPPNRTRLDDSDAGDQEYAWDGDPRRFSDFVVVFHDLRRQDVVGLDLDCEMSARGRPLLFALWVDVVPGGPFEVGVTSSYAIGLPPQVPWLFELSLPSSLTPDDLTLLWRAVGRGWSEG